MFWLWNEADDGFVQIRVILTIIEDQAMMTWGHLTELVI